MDAKEKNQLFRMAFERRIEIMYSMRIALPKGTNPIEAMNAAIMLIADLLVDTGVSDEECMNAFFTLSRVEGIIPALESSHALALAMREAPKRPYESILVNLSGRGDKDIDYVVEHYGTGSKE